MALARAAHDGPDNHETHLPALESSPRQDAWISGSHEDARRPCRPQRQAGQGPQAPVVGLTPSAPLGSRMLDRLSRPADFEAVLAAPVKARSAHFAAHHLPQSPRSRVGTTQDANAIELSTGGSEGCTQTVDDRREQTPNAWWFAVVVPKRHARKATTRNLLRRQARGALIRHHARLARGMWLVRLRSPFDTRVFKAAASAALRGAARTELDALLMRAAA
jgi:ribonuclease P protein component